MPFTDHCARIHRSSQRERNAHDVQTSAGFCTGCLGVDFRTEVHSPLHLPPALAPRTKRPRCLNILPVPSPYTGETPTMSKHPPRSVPYTGETPTMFKHPPRSVSSASETPTMFKHPPCSVPLRGRNSHDVQTSSPFRPLRGRNSHDVQTSAGFCTHRLGVDFRTEVHPPLHLPRAPAPRTKRPRCPNILPVPSPTRAKLPRCSNILPVPSPQRVKLPRCSNIRRVLHPPPWRRLPNRGPPTPPSPSRPRSANETPTMSKHPPRSVPYAGETPTMFKHPPRSVPSASETPTMFKHPPGSAPTALASTSEPRSTHRSISLAPPLRERNAHDV